MRTRTSTSGHYLISSYAPSRRGSRGIFVATTFSRDMERVLRSTPEDRLDRLADSWGMDPQVIRNKWTHLNSLAKR